MEWGEIVAEISIMMNAGSDTTAIAMNNAMCLLLANPACLTKLRAELDAVIDPSDVTIPYDKVRHLPYLHACLDEALRLYPPTTFGLPRRTPFEGAPILGDFIPGDTSVSISAYVAHRDPKVFPEPDEYRPERWLGDDAKELQAAFIAFSTGARGCIGRNISYLEQTVLLASVVHRFEFALPHEGWVPDSSSNAGTKKIRGIASRHPAPNITPEFLRIASFLRIPLIKPYKAYPQLLTALCDLQEVLLRTRLCLNLQHSDMCFMVTINTSDWSIGHLFLQTRWFK
ncbi:cytochrome P450 [Halenospora varia]|nr:cytochrome P450 [Halenospora varia]